MHTHLSKSLDHHVSYGRLSFGLPLFCKLRAVVATMLQAYDAAVNYVISELAMLGEHPGIEVALLKSRHDPSIYKVAFTLSLIVNHVRTMAYVERQIDHHMCSVIYVSNGMTYIPP